MNKKFQYRQSHVGCWYTRMSDLTEQEVFWHHKKGTCEKLSKHFRFDLYKLDTLNNLETSKELIRKMYWDDKMSPEEIKDFLNFDHNVFAQFIQCNLKIPLRSLKDSVKNYFIKIGACDNISEKDQYWKDCSFNFDPFMYPQIPGYELLSKYRFQKHFGDSPNETLHRDHMVSIYYGWYNKIDPKIISHPANCHIMTSSENTYKRQSTSITLDDLLERINKWNSKDIGLPVFNHRSLPRTEEWRNNLSKANKGKKAYNNGINNIWLLPNKPIPEGYTLGTLKRRKQDY